MSTSTPVSNPEPPAVLLLGDPALREASARLDPNADARFPDEVAALRRRLERFRAEHGFGRAIAAPQVAIRKRFIAMHLDGRDHTIVNPRITWRSTGRFTLWDDCMSFPDRLVKVSRHVSISLVYQDEKGRWHHWQRLPRDLSELFQHEIDHLDGVLAVDRALGPAAIVPRDAFEANREHYLRQVDGA